MVKIEEESLYTAYKLIVMNNLELGYSDWGIASRIDRHIILNRNLLRYPDLLLSIVKHEIDHSNSYNVQDFISDIAIKQKGLWKFVLRHPKALSQFIPVGRYKTYLWIDWTLMIIYLVLGVSIWALMTIR